MVGRAERLRREVLEPRFERLKALHAPKAKPQPGDWLAEQPESGQSVAEYLSLDFVGVDAKRSVIYLQPLGDFSPAQAQVVALTHDYVGRYFGLEVRMLPRLPSSTIPAQARRLHPGPQVFSPWVLDYLVKRRPSDAVALLALTAEDLFPDPRWNFVYGQASLHEHVGVWSIYRNGDPAESVAAFEHCLHRTLGTAVHELSHMLWIVHCIAWECVMNGSNHDLEADARPLEPCPSCLAKLCHAVRCDPLKRFEAIEPFWRDRPRGHTLDYVRAARLLAEAAPSPEQEARSP